MVYQIFLNPLITSKNGNFDCISPLERGVRREWFRHVSYPQVLKVMTQNFSNNLLDREEIINIIKRAFKEKKSILHLGKYYEPNDDSQPQYAKYSNCFT